MRTNIGQLRRLIREALEQANGGNDFGTALDDVINDMYNTTKKVEQVHELAPEGQAKAIVAGIYSDMFNGLAEFRKYVRQLKAMAAKGSQKSEHVMREALQGDYKISVSPELQGVRLSRMPQLSFALNTKTGDLIIGRSGHGKLTRGADKHDYEGGWIFPPDNKVVFYSGTLGTVTDQDGVLSALESALGTSLEPTD